MDRSLSTSQVGEMTARFKEVDQKMRFLPDKYLQFIEKLEMHFSAQKENRV
jgi:hypothetical protein